MTKAADGRACPLRVLRAIGDRKVVVLLFWNPKAADDRAVRKALAGIDRHHHKVLAHADAHQEDRRVPADHPRRRRRAVADRRGHRPRPQGRRRSSATSIAPRSTRPSPTRCARSSSAAYTRRVDAEAFEEHLAYPQGRGHVPAGAVTGSAGGAACGDLVRIDLALAGDRVADAGFEASGCGAASPRARPPSRSRAAPALLDAARIGAGEIVGRAGRAVAGQAARRRAGGRRAARRARRRRARPRARVPAARRPHARRDERRRRLGRRRAARAARAGREAVAVTLELWRDPANDAEASCCSAHAVRLARSVAHRMGLPHFTLDLRAGVRRRRRRAVPRRPRRRADAEPVRALQRRRAARRDARLRRPPRRRRPRHRPLRAGHAPTGCCASPPTRRRTRATCSPRSRRRRSRGCASRSAS